MPPPSSGSGWPGGRRDSSAVHAAGRCAGRVDLDAVYPDRGPPRHISGPCGTAPLESAPHPASNHASTSVSASPPCSPLPLAACLGLTPVTASGQSIGAYNPPVTWPERPRRFDLIHQRIAIGVDWSHLSIHGQVQTTVVATTVTDTVRLDADHLTITSATDARGRKLKFTADTTHVTVRMPKRSPRRHRGVQRRTPACPSAACTSCRGATWSGPRVKPSRPGPGYRRTTSRTTRPPGNSW